MLMVDSSDVPWPARQTVSTHEEHMYAKLGVRSRGTAALFAMWHGLTAVGEPPTEIREINRAKTRCVARHLRRTTSA